MVTLDGLRAIDTTWPFEPSTEYFGIPFPTKLVARLGLQTGLAGAFLERGLDWHTLGPLELKGRRGLLIAVHRAS